MTAELLNEKFAIPNAVQFEKRNGLVCASLKSSSGEARVFLHGGHVAHYQLQGQRSVLFVSAKSSFESGKPIRGGVPVCWPWFGARGPTPDSPMHGFARTMEWEVESTNRVGAGAVSIAMVLRSNEQTRRFWPNDFELRHVVTVGPTLKMELTTKNISQKAFTIEEALHTYFAVSDVRNVSLSGLEGVRYETKVKGKQHGVQGNEPLRFDSETDSVYMQTAATCVIHDPTWKRKIRVEKSGSGTTVVWNPWVDRAKAMPDFGDEEWPGMLCVESGNTHDSAVKVEPGGSHTIAAVVEAMPM
jgi:glucose-6-phosphate 1-epimerase